VSVRYGCELISYTQDAESVSAQIKRAGGSSTTVRAKYLVGCDGGSSVVRKKLGIKLAGEGNLLHLRQALYRCDDLYERIPIGKGRHYHVADAQSTQLIVQDDTRHFTLHSVVEKDEDMATMFEKTCAMPVKYEMLYVGPWTQHLLLADRYGEGRVLLAGDAVHLVIPTGGLGMNTGAGDAIDLGWKLAATLQGWGGPNLLKSYEVERRQIGERNVAASPMPPADAAFGVLRTNRTSVTIHRKVRRRVQPLRIADVEQRKTNEMIGAAARYAGSPIIWPEPGEGPKHDFMNYVPTTWPGARLRMFGSTTAARWPISSDKVIRCCALAARKRMPPLARGFESYGAPFTILDVHDKNARKFTAMI
jgi:hypothetical protein